MNQHNIRLAYSKADLSQICPPHKNNKTPDLKKGLWGHGVGFESFHSHVQPALPLALPHLPKVARTQLEDNSSSNCTYRCYREKNKTTS